MGMRKYYRAIAKDRLRAMGVERINKQMGIHINNKQLREAFRHMGKEKKRQLREELRTKPMWRRVLWGNLKKDAWNAQVGRFMNGRGRVRRKAIKAAK